MDDPLFVALLARAGGTAVLSPSELAAASTMQVSGSRNPATGEVHLRLLDI